MTKISKHLAAGLMAVSLMGTAKAGDLKAYVGLDLQRTIYNYNNNYDIGNGLALDGDLVLEDAFNGVNIHVGVRPHEYWGAEIGFFKNKDGNKNISSGDVVGPNTVASADFSTKVETSGITLDGIAYYPIAETQWELLGSAGVSWTKAKLTLNVPGSVIVSVKESEFGLRAGAGVQFKVNERINFRGMARYQQTDFENTTDRGIVYVFGVNYQF